MILSVYFYPKWTNLCVQNSNEPLKIFTAFMVWYKIIDNEGIMRTSLPASV